MMHPTVSTMEKPAPTDHPILELLKRRWSPVTFAPVSVEPRKLQLLFEAARWAPSSFNEQPCSFVVAVRDRPVEFAALLSCLSPKNALWVQDAPVLMFSVAQLNFERTQQPNRHAFHDVGLAVENLVIEAMSHGIFVHQMAGFDIEKARQVCRIPATHEPVAAIALGYPGDPTTASPEHQARNRSPRSRKELSKMVFSGTFGTPSPLV